MTPQPPARPARPGGTRPGLAAVAFGLLLLGSGCGPLLREGTADLAGVGGAAAATAVEAGPALATGIGLGVRSLAATGLQAAERRVRREEQVAIATAAGPLEPDQVGPWRVRHAVALEPNRGGEVAVSRRIGGGAFECKEVVFSIERRAREPEVRRSFYVATVCRDGDRWAWATAEPSTARWGALQ